MSDKKYYLIHKPFNVISQFTKENHDDITLSDLGYTFPKDVYSVGRLDKDSEGLLLLTNDNKVKTTILSPKSQKSKTYWAQVENIPTPEAISKLSRGVVINVDKKDYKTLPAQVKLLTKEPKVFERDPPIRERKSIPTAWLEITLVEGKNRQVRKMCAAIGFPVLRLIRSRIATLSIADMKIGEIKELSRKELNGLFLL
jgi:23S rRNA pseudouridine2457 synthase